MSPEENLSQTIKDIIKATKESRPKPTQRRWAFIQIGYYRSRRDGLLLVRRPLPEALELVLFAWDGREFRSEGSTAEIGYWSFERIKIGATQWADMVAKNFNVGHPA
jgi:hypothetical protein